MELDIRLPCEERSAYAARRCVDGLAPFLAAKDAEELRVLVNELVTNSILHVGSAAHSGHGWIELSIKIIQGKRARAEVVDHGPGFNPSIPQRVDDADQMSGRGLFLVEHLADAWGVVTGESTRVWFELELTSKAHAGGDLAFADGL